MKNSVCPKAKVIRKPNLSEYLPNVPKCGFNTRHDNREVTLIHLTRAQTLRSDKCATGLIQVNGSMTINVIPWKLFCRSSLCLATSAIHLRSKLQTTIIFAVITIHWALRRIFWKMSCVSDDDKCYGENMSLPENYKKFEFDSANEE